MSKTIGSFGRMWEADLAIALLRDNEFHPDDLLTFSRTGLGGAESFFYVVVPDTEVQAAVQVLKDNGYGQNIAQPSA